MLLIMFASSDESNGSPEQLGHHVIESPLKNYPSCRVWLLGNIGNHARDQGDPNVLADRYLAQLLCCQIPCSEATRVHDSRRLMEPLVVKMINGVFEHWWIAMIVLR